MRSTLRFAAPAYHVTSRNIVVQIDGESILYSFAHSAAHYIHTLISITQLIFRTTYKAGCNRVRVCLRLRRIVKKQKTSEQSKVKIDESDCRYTVLGPLALAVSMHTYYIHILLLTEPHTQDMYRSE